MKLERHVGGLSTARKVEYLHRRGWRQEDGGWSSERLGLGPVPVKKAVHHQLTADLTAALASSGWAVMGYSQRGYARLKDPLDERPCSLPAALRRQARREKRPVGELTYTLFLAALLEGDAPSRG